MKLFNKYWLMLTLSVSFTTNAKIGDVVFNIVAPDVNSNFIIDAKNSQFLSLSSNGVEYHDLTGLFVKSVPFENVISPVGYFTQGFSLINSQSLVGVGNVGNNQDQLSVWQLGLDSNNDEIFVLQSTVDLSSFGTISWFNRAPDGSYWFLTDEFTITHLSSSFTELSSTPFGIPFQGMTGVTGSSSPNDPSLTIEASTGNLILISYGNYIDESQNRNLRSMITAYYLNPTDMSIIGRFQANFQEWEKITSSNGVMYYSSGTSIIGYELSALQAPTLASFNSDLIGLVWRECEYVTGFGFLFNSDAHFSVSVNWGSINSGILGLASSSIFYSPPDLTSSQNFNVGYNLNDITLHTDPIPRATIELVNSDGQSSGAIDVEMDFKASYAPGFHVSCASYGYTEEFILGAGTVGKWTLASNFPVTPLNANIEFDEAFPFIGGKTFGVTDLQMAFEANMIGQGTDKVTMSGGGVFEAGIGGVGFKAGLGATTELTESEVLFDKGLFNFQISGLIKAEQPLLELFPAFAALANTPFIGRVLGVLTSAANGVAEIKLTSDSTVLASVPDGNLYNLCIEGNQELILGLKAGVVIELIKGIAEVSVFGGGNSKITWKSIPDQCPSMAFNNFVIQMYLTGKYVLFSSTATLEHIHSIKYPFPENRKHSESKKVSEVWSYTYPGNLRPNKSAIIPKLDEPNPFIKALENAQGTGEPTSQIPILTGIGRDSKPVAALAPNGTAMLLWVQERSNLPAVQSTEIYYSYYNGSTFSTPAAITNDTHADFNPIVAYHNSGKWVAAWTHVRDPNLQISGDPQADAKIQSQQLSPMFSIFNPNNSSWSSVTEVPDINENITILESGSSYLLHFATGPQNELALLWLTNPNQDLFPFDIDSQSFTSTNYVYWSLFDGNDFSLTGTLRQGSRTTFLAMDLTGAYTGSELLIGFNEPFGNNYANPSFFIYRSATPTNSFTLFERPPSTIGFNQGAGQKIRIMNNDNIAVASAKEDKIRVSYGPSWNTFNQLRIIYQDAINPLDECNIYGCSSEFRDSFQLGETTDGKLFTVAPDIRNGNPDFILSIEDENTTAVSLKGLFQESPVVEKYMSTATDSQGNIVMFYYQSDLIIDNVMVDLGDGEESFIRTREADTGRIMMAVHQINKDLSVENVNHNIGLSETGHQSKVFATVFNNGDLPVDSPKISFFARDISEEIEKNRGSDITIVENLLAYDGLLAAGSKVEVSVDWIIPDDADYQVYVTVDPLDEIEEFNENNNVGDGPPADLIFRNGFD